MREISLDTNYEHAVSFLVRNRIRLSFIVFSIILLEIAITGVSPHDVLSVYDLWGLTGLLLVLIGVGLRSWAAGILKKGSLTTTGPYLLVRHPLYFGSLLMSLGFSAIIGDAQNLWVVIGVAGVLYIPKVRREEQSLGRRYRHEWDEYTGSVSTFFPKRFPQGIDSNWSLSQWLRNKEYRALVTTLIFLVILEYLHILHTFHTWR